MKGWFEIFKVGKHTDSAGRTREWTEEDVKRIAESYNAQEHEAPIIFNEQKFHLVFNNYNRWFLLKL